MVCAFHIFSEVVINPKPEPPKDELPPLQGPGIVGARR